MPAMEHLLNTGIRPEVIEELRRLAGEYGIRKMVLFGSRARGDYRRDSDIDLAVSGGNIDLFRLAAEEDTSTLLQYDVIDLDNTASPELLSSRSLTTIRKTWLFSPRPVPRIFPTSSSSEAL